MCWEVVAGEAVAVVRLVARQTTHGSPAQVVTVPGPSKLVIVMLGCRNVTSTWNMTLVCI